MRVIYGINNFRRLRKPVVALGVFDGVHLGHRRILSSLVRTAHRIGGTSVVLTFWPHPQGEESLYSLSHRLKFIADLGVDAALVISFNKAFAKLPAEAFIKRILVDRIRAQRIFVGENFKFGKKAGGDIATLRKASRIHGFKVKSFRVQKSGRRAISSTFIRALIKKGNLKKAQQLLGRPVSILGTVIRGVALGRKLGFPTANIDPHHEVIPPEGVYAVRVFLDDQKYGGACYIGPKPVFPALAKRRKHPKKSLNIEVTLFDFHKDIYGKDMEVIFFKKMRPVRKFSSPAALAAQISKDIQKARKLF